MGLISKIEEVIYHSSSKKGDSQEASLDSQPTTHSAAIDSATGTGIGHSAEHHTTNTSSANPTNETQPSHNSTMLGSDAGLSESSAGKHHVHFGQTGTNDHQPTGVSGIGSNLNNSRSGASTDVTGSTAGVGNTLADRQTAQNGQSEHRSSTTADPSSLTDQQYGANSSREQQSAAATIGSSDFSTTRSHTTQHETEKTPGEDPTVNLTGDGGIEKKHTHSHSHSGTQDVSGFYPNLENPDAIPEAGGLKVGSHVGGHGRDFDSEQQGSDGYEPRQHEHHIGRDAALATGAASAGAHEEGRLHHHDRGSPNVAFQGANKDHSTGIKHHEHDKHHKHHHHDAKHDHEGRDAILATGAAGLGAHELESSRRHREQDALQPGQSSNAFGETVDGHEHRNHHNAKHDHRGEVGLATATTALGAHELGKDHHHEHVSDLPGQSSQVRDSDSSAAIGGEHYGKHPGHHVHPVESGSAITSGLGSAGVGAHELNKHHQHSQASQTPGQSALIAPQPGTTLLSHDRTGGLDQMSGLHQHPGQAADLTNPTNVSYMNRTSADPYAERYGPNATGVEHNLSDRVVPGSLPQHHHHHHGLDGAGLSDTKRHERRFDSGNHSDLASAGLLGHPHDHNSTHIPAKTLAAEQRVGGTDEAHYRQTLDRVRAEIKETL